MLRRSGSRRAGVTLIELLVVVGIIATLMSLLVAGVMRVRQVGPKTDTMTRIGGISGSIDTFKGSTTAQVKYIPPGRFEPGQGWRPFRLRNSYPAPGSAATGEPDAFSFEAQYIIAVFGVRPINNAIADLGWPGLRADLDANQTLTFFLTGRPEVSGQDAAFTGFSSDSQHPFKPRTSTDETRKGPYIDISGGSPKRYAMGSNSFARMIDGYGNPFAYFASRDGKQNADYGGYNDPAVYGAVRPYGAGNQFEKPSGFQIISAGKDGAFGISGNWRAVDAAGQDDLANFATAQLGAGPN